MKENIALVPEMSAHEYFQWTILENGTFRLVSGGIVESFPEELPFTGREFEYKNVHDPLSAVYSNEVPNYEKYRGLLAARAFLRQVEAH